MECNYKKIHSPGFSLVELSAVIVIIGLLVGGIVAGKSLVRASEIRSIITDKDKYIAAISSFKDQYGTLPGDLSNAESYWGTDSGGCPYTPKNTLGKKETCNGNGDGVIYSSSTYFNEGWRAWQHLSNAGLIDGSYTGTCGTAGACTTSATYALIGVNVPKSKIAGAGFTLLNIDQGFSGASNGTNPSFFSADYGNAMFFGAPHETYFTTQSVLTPDDAYSIDVKIDDGKPAYGQVIEYIDSSGTNGACMTSTTALTAGYDFTKKSSICTLIFITGF